MASCNNGVKRSGQFAGQCAIVTGGARGLGEGIVRMLVEGGCGVMIFDLLEEEGLEACRRLSECAIAASSSGEGGSGVAAVRFCRVDVSDEASVRRGFEEFRASFPRLDVMVNCAGIVGPNGVKTDEVTCEDFDRVYAVNVRGSFLVTKYSLLEMKKNNYGRILLVASIAGKEGNPGMMAYSTSKAAVIGMVKSVGKEYAETGITVNALAPAVVRTKMVDAMDPEQVKYMTSKIPMKRCCTMEEVASITRFIVSREASFNTAFCFDLTGGRATY